MKYIVIYQTKRGEIYAFTKLTGEAFVFESFEEAELYAKELEIDHIKSKVIKIQ